ncbi:MAG TPA: DUF3429 domain-containing protein [Phenylobacterium sp.]|nr:DUF3429 domain-containing protein [Phenylobacterium sp.]
MDEAVSVSRDEAPPVALWAIAALALAPFPIAAGVYAYGPHDVVRPSLTVILTWSAVVLSFLGGVRWGLETSLSRPRLYRHGISVASAAAAWGLLLARGRVPDSWVIGGTIAAFLIQWMFDHQAPEVPARYPKLSTTVTAAACVSLAVCLDMAIRG